MNSSCKSWHASLSLSLYITNHLHHPILFLPWLSASELFSCCPAYKQGSIGHDRGRYVEWCNTWGERCQACLELVQWSLPSVPSSPSAHRTWSLKMWKKPRVATYLPPEAESPRDQPGSLQTWAKSLKYLLKLKLRRWTSVAAPPFLTLVCRSRCLLGSYSTHPHPPRHPPPLLPSSSPFPWSAPPQAPVPPALPRRSEYPDIIFQEWYFNW